MNTRLFLVGTIGLSLLAAGSSFGAATKITAMVPADGAREVCPDTLLRLTFDDAPTLGTSGTIAIYSASGELADSIDLSNSVHGAQPRTLGGPIFTNRPVIISGNEATIFPHLGVLHYGQEYRIAISPEVFGGVTNAGTWTIHTKAAGPAADAAKLTVAADGSGDFCTVQGAVDWVPVGNTAPRQFFIKNGVYQEIVYVTNKAHLTFAGEDRKKTVIEYANNEAFNYRGLRRNLYRQTIGIDADDFTIQNMTVHNTTPKRGSQAEALRIDGRRCVVDGVDFLSFQDTLKLSGEVFIKNCYIEGDVDFIWGFGTCFFTNCEIKSITSGACITQIRNTATNNGDVFLDCRLTRAPGVTNAWLSRIDASVYPYSHVAWINCAMDPDLLRPVAWQTTRGTTNSDATMRYWEYQSTDLTGKTPLDVSRRAANSRQITADQAAQMRDAHQVFGDWTPAD